MSRFGNSIIALVVALMLGVVRLAGAQELAVADAGQGPRFLLASASRLVPLDVDRTPSLARRLELRLDGVTLKQALAEIARRAGLRLAFSDSDVPLERRVHLRAEAITVAAALTDVLLGTGVDVVFGGDGGASLVKRSDAAVAQLGRVVGQVTDEVKKEGIAGAEVLLEGTKWRTLTGEDGRYMLAEVEPGSYTITARRIGYAKRSEPLTVGDGQEVVADFALRLAGTTLREIVVTAQKREERLINVPISVVAVGADELQQRGITSLNDLQFAVPGMSIFDQGLARLIQVRGIANITAGTTALVGVYLDEAAVTLTGTQQMNPSTYDLERVEVLRGPQGTLYGEGSAGGTVRFITKSPVLDRFGMTADAAALFTEDGARGQRVNAAINVPLIKNELGLRFAGTFDREGGWIDQPATDRKDINGQDLTNVRVKALWGPSPQFTVNAMAQIYRNDQSTGIGEDANGNYTQTFNLTTTPRVVQDHNIWNLTLTYDFPAVRVLSTTSYVEATNETLNFGSISPVFPPPAAPFDYYAPQWLFNNRVWVEELRLTSSGAGPWQWTAGGFYRHHRFEQDQPVGYSEQPGPPGTPLPTPFDIKSTNLFDSWAAFGDMSYRLTDRLTLGAGVRYFQDDQEFASGFGFGAPAVLGPKQTGSFESVDPRFYAQYKLTNEINVYTSAAKGFRSGGFNALDQPRFDPEGVWTYELGTKMWLFERRLRADMAVFYSDYTDYVVFGLEPVFLFPINSNAGDARIKGIEWDLEWQPADQWTLGFNGDYLDTEFTKINATSTAFVEGDPLDFVPEYQFTVSAQRDIKWNGRRGLMRLDYSQQGPITTRNRSIGPWYFSASDVVDLLNYDMRLQWTENLSLNLFAQNLLNDRGFMSGAGVERIAARPRPRTYGIGFSVTF